jgi:regulator of nucleoside diphosphate kinase
MDMEKMELLPEITITHEDLAILSETVAEAMGKGRIEAACRLAHEMHRARIVPAAKAPRECLGLKSAGRYLDERSGAIHDAVLVANSGRPASGTVSVLSEVGSALIGLSEGQRIGWLDRFGRPRVLQLLEVRRWAS